MMRRIAIYSALAATVACSNAGENLGLPPTGTGPLGVVVYFDRDGTGTFTPFDTVYAGALVALFVEQATDTLAIQATGEDGFAGFLGVPFGRYRFGLVASSLGDSLPVIDGDDVQFTLTADPDSATLGTTVRVSHATLTIPDVRLAPSGQRVFVHGTVTSGLQYFSDSASFITSGGASIRIIPTTHRPGRSGNNPGDSVIVLGTVGADNGQPVLIGGLVFSVSQNPPPVAEEVSVEEVGSARGGDLDAAFVHLAQSTIADTATVGVDFHVWVYSGTDTSLVVIDSTVAVPTDAFAPEREAEWRGVLVPAGDGSWYLKPRPVNGDIVLN